MKKIARRATMAVLAWMIALAPSPAPAQVQEWYLKVGSWNLLNLSMSKATYPNGTDRAQLLTRMGQIAANYDIIIFQEVLQTGASLTQHLANYLPPGYACNWMSAASGRSGRQERYAICAKAQAQWGTIAIAPLTDYSTTGANYRAANGTNQAAASVWMRPPVIARVTFTPTNPVFAPFVFDIYTIHTKPAYGNNIPPGAPPMAPNTSSVHYELRAVEQNLAAGAKQMVIGDLNADCAFYPTAYRGTDLAGWNWYVGYGQRTSTAVGASCGYDRIILNPALNAYRRASDVDYPGYDNTTRLDTRRISDHYPIWVEFYERRQVQPRPKRALTSASSLPVSEAKRQRKYATTDSVNITGTSLPANQASGQLYVAMTNAALSYKSNMIYTLTDVRGRPSTAPTDANGNFSSAVSWPSPPAGAYTFVFDANGDGRFNRADGDFANADSEADIYVTAATVGHNDLVTLGDNMVSRDVFNLAQAKNVYLLGKNLPANFAGNAYVLSWKLLNAAGYRSWPAARADRIDLATYAVPIQRPSGGMIETSALTAADRQQPFTTNPRGELFISVWSKPAQLMNATVNYRPPPDSAFSPSQGGSGDPPASPDDTGYEEDVCQSAYRSDDTNLKKACNFGYRFRDYYGDTFSIALDLDGDGKLSASDPIDVRDIGDMTRFFARPGGDSLGPGANGDPAVSEYKEYLSRALSLDLDSDNIFDTATQAASARYACGPSLSKAAFQRWITPDANTGFRVLDPKAYSDARSQASGIQQYDGAYFDGADYADASVCTTGNDLAYSGAINLSQGSKVTSVAPIQMIDNATINANNATLCLAGVQGAAGTTLLVGAGSSYFTFGVSALAALVAATVIEVGGTIVCAAKSL